MTARGGRIPPDGRPVQAPGVGKNSKRHDLERRNVPFLHGSDLQVGDVQAMEQGQRIAPKQTQAPAAPPSRGGGSGQQTTTTGGAAMAPPDPIEFLAGRIGGQPLQAPPRRADIKNSKAMAWLPLVRQMAAGPGSSGVLASALINQMRALSRMPVRDVTVIDMQDVDAALEAMNAALDQE